MYVLADFKFLLRICELCPRTVLCIQAIDSVFTGIDKHKISAQSCKYFLTNSISICFGCSKNRLIVMVYLEYPQHMVWLRNNNKKICWTILTKVLD